MNKFLITACLISLLFIACNSKNTTGESQTVSSYIPDSTVTEAPQAPSSSAIDQTSDQGVLDSNSNSDLQEYNAGYAFGHDMGYIAGQDNMEYNPYLPVGPNVRTYSLKYRNGYAAGYSTGYEKGQQTAHQGIYSEDDDYEYEEEFYYDDEF